MMYGLYGNYGRGYGMMNDPLGGLMMILVLALAVLFIVWVVKEISGKHSSSSSRALDILKERYAKGEIGKEEFDARKKDL